MATTLTVNNIQVALSFQYDNPLAIAPAKQSGSFNYLKSLADGTGAGAANKIYQNRLTIAGGATTTLDLNSTTGTPTTDIFGNNLAFTKVRLLYVHHRTTTTASAITVGGNASAFKNWVADASDKVKVKNGACLLVCRTDADGYAVVDSTGDLLDIVNLDGSNAATVDVVIIGE